MATAIHLDYAAVGEVLKNTCRPVIDETGRAVAANVLAQGHVTSDGAPLPVETVSYTTDRAAVAVTLAHPAGLPMQAMYGVLTRAAGEAGLEVHGG